MELTRRRALALLVCVTSLAAAIAPEVADARRPNIVLIETDDQTNASVRYMPWCAG
jgi:hypothetical protein